MRKITSLYVIILLVLLLSPQNAWAPGSCPTFKTFGANEILTSGDLNNSFTQAAVTNSTSQCLDDYSANAAQTQTQTDPFPADALSLATSTSGELERIRFVIAEITGNAFWYENTPYALNSNPFVPVGHLAMRNGDLTIGHNTVFTGTLIFEHSASSFETRFQAGNATHTVTYTWPLDGSAENSLLSGNVDHVMAWVQNISIGHAGARTNQLIFYHSASSFATSFQGHASTVADVTYTWPQADGTTHQIIATDGSGNFFFKDDLNTIVAPSTDLPRSYLAGLGLSTHATVTTHMIAVAVGEARDSDDSANIALSSVFNKHLGATWTQGDNLGGLFSGTIAADTTYHFCVIFHAAASVSDAGFDTEVTCSNAPANWTDARRVGSVITDSTSNILAFVQHGDEFLWVVPPALEVDGAAGTAEVILTVTVPEHIIVMARMNVQMTNGVVYVSSLDVGNHAASTTATPLGSSGAVADAAVAQVAALTNTSAQIRYRGSNNDTLRIATYGWKDRRGRDD